MHKVTLFKPEKGFSIVELMIGLAIGLILVAAASTVWLSSKQSYNIQHDLAEIQDTGRFAVSFLQREFREVSFMGCAGSKTSRGDCSSGNNYNICTMVSDSDISTNLKNLDNLVEGLEKKGIDNNTWNEGNETISSDTNWLPGNLSDLDDTIASLSGQSQIKDGTDAITLRGFDFDGFGVTSINSEARYIDELDTKDVNATSITLDQESNFKEHQIVGLINCGGGTVFQLEDDADEYTVEMKSSDKLTRGFKTEHLSGGNSLVPKLFPTSLYSYHAYRYYVRPYHVANNPFGPSLWRISLNSSGVSVNEEVIPGVENMQILYGVNTNTKPGPDKYLAAGDSEMNTLWDSVSSIKIALLIRTQNSNKSGSGNETSSYQLLDETITLDLSRSENNNRRRKVFETEIALRNRT